MHSGTGIGQNNLQNNMHCLCTPACECFSVLTHHLSTSANLVLKAIIVCPSDHRKADTHACTLLNKQVYTCTVLSGYSKGKTPVVYTPHLPTVSSR